MDFTWWQVLLFWAVLIVAVVAYVKIKEKSNLKKAATGEDQGRIVGIFKTLLPETWENYKIAFAHWEKTEYRGRTRITHYWSYAIAFSNDELFVAPLLCEDREIRYKNWFRITAGDLGMINAREDGNWMTLYDNEQKSFLTLQVDAENTKSDRYHPVNIVQREETDAFKALVSNWLKEVNGKKGIEVSGIPDYPFKIKKKKKKKE